MLISAGENLSGYKILEYKDIVFGTSNSSEGIGFKHSALTKMADAADKIGANAVVNFKMEIYTLTDNLLEATAYGNAVVINSSEGNVKQENKKINIEAYIPKPKKNSSPVAKICEVNGYKFAVCPKCGTKYKAEEDSNGELHIKGFDDVDDIEPGLQVYCLRCGEKFTVQ